jgi:hypothetical protein
MIFTPYNIRALKRASYSRFAFGITLLTYRVDTNLRGESEIAFEYYTPLDFQPRFDSFGKIIDVAVVYDVVITDPKEIEEYKAAGNTM